MVGNSGTRLNWWSLELGILQRLSMNAEGAYRGRCEEIARNKAAANELLNKSVNQPKFSPPKKLQDPLNLKEDSRDLKKLKLETDKLISDRQKSRSNIKTDSQDTDTMSEGTDSDGTNRQSTPKSQRQRVNRRNHRHTETERIPTKYNTSINQGETYRRTNGLIDSIQLTTGENIRNSNINDSSVAERDLQDDVGYLVTLMNKKSDYNEFITLLKSELNITDSDNAKIFIGKKDCDSFPQFSGSTIQHFCKYLKRFHNFAITSIRFENYQWIDQLLKRVNKGFLKQYLTELVTDELTYMQLVIFLLDTLDLVNITKVYDESDKYHKAEMGTNETTVGFGNRLKALFISCFPSRNFNDNVELKNKLMASIQTEVKVELIELISEMEIIVNRNLNFTEIIRLTNRVDKLAAKSNLNINYQIKQPISPKTNSINQIKSTVDTSHQNKTRPRSSSIEKNKKPVPAINFKLEDMTNNQVFQCPDCKSCNNKLKKFKNIPSSVTLNVISNQGPPNNLNIASQFEHKIPINENGIISDTLVNTNSNKKKNKKIKNPVKNNKFSNTKGMRRALSKNVHTIPIKEPVKQLEMCSSDLKSCIKKDYNNLQINKKALNWNVKMEQVTFAPHKPSYDEPGAHLIDKETTPPYKNPNNCETHGKACKINNINSTKAVDYHPNKKDIFAFDHLEPGITINGLPDVQYHLLAGKGELIYNSKDRLKTFRFFVGINKLVIEAEIDSGSQVSSVSRELVEKLKLPITLLTERDVTRGITGNDLITLGYVDIELILHDIKFPPFKFHVIEHWPRLMHVA
ncbi:unnamed protein product [Rotaria magnacalcarata]|uniref:Uncharacterized protein n=1 Tax=Rotaria magnacalcarata TaxID=392030 RepID=A0A820H0K8_9BILA|nr:unnamed protein product [Rotaria magnacalcarata]